MVKERTATKRFDWARIWTVSLTLFILVMLGTIIVVASRWPERGDMAMGSAPEQVSLRTGAERRRAVVRVGERAPVQREAAAADAVGHRGLQALELGDLVVDAAAPAGGEGRPVRAGRGAAVAGRAGHP